MNIKPTLIINDQLTLKDCALNNMGIAYLQQHVVDNELRLGKLIEVLPDYTEKQCTIPINLYYLKRRHLHSKIRAFLDFICR